MSGVDLVRKPLISRGLAKRAQRMTALFDRIFYDRAAEELVAASKGPAYLSKENKFKERVEQLQNGVATLQRTLLGSLH